MANLNHLGIFPYTNASEFSKQFQIACVAQGKPPITPTEHIEQSGTKRYRRNNDPKKGKKTAAIFDKYNSRADGGCKRGRTIGSGHQH